MTDAPEGVGRSIWLDDPANFERLRQNFTTSLLIHGPNMTLPDMSAKLCEMYRELEQARARLAAAEKMAEALRNLRAHRPDYADTIWDDAHYALTAWEAAKGDRG